MKKRFILLLALLINFIIIGSVSAKTCKYTAILGGCAQNKGYVNSNVCLKSQEKTGPTGLNSSFTRNATGSFSHPSNNTNTVNAKINYLAEESKSRSISCGIKNWTKDENGKNYGAEIFGDGTTKGYKSGTCPDYLVVRTTVWQGSFLNLFETCDAWLAPSQSNSETILREKLKEQDNRAYMFIMKLDDSSSTEEQKETHVSCKEFTDEGKDVCENNDEFSCIWVEKSVNDQNWSYCNYDKLNYVNCGTVMDLPNKLPSITSFLVNILKIAAPLILIFVSVISLIKAIASSKEEDIKKAQNSLIKKIIAAALVFFIVQITQFVILKVANSADSEDISACFSCLLNNDCSKNLYYKTQGMDKDATGEYKDGQNYTCTYQSGEVTPCY